MYTTPNNVNIEAIIAIIQSINPRIPPEYQPIPVSAFFSASITSSFSVFSNFIFIVFIDNSMLNSRENQSSIFVRCSVATFIPIVIKKLPKTNILTLYNKHNVFFSPINSFIIYLGITMLKNGAIATKIIFINKYI